MYWLYFWRVMLHKWYVLQECRKAGIFWRGVTHDLSKFRRDEFFPYADYFQWFLYGDTEDYEPVFKKAVRLHKSRNPHHPEFWVKDGIPEEMDHDSVLEMACDWVAFARSHAGSTSAREYYLSNRIRLELHPRTREALECELGFIPDELPPAQPGSWMKCPGCGKWEDVDDPDEDILFIGPDDAIEIRHHKCYG